MKRFKLVTHMRAVASTLLAAGLVAGCESTAPVEPELGLSNVPAAANLPADAYGYTVFDVPGATNTYLFRMNARGDLAGTYNDASGTHGFLQRKGDRLQTINVEGAIATQVRGVNDRGDVVGFYSEAGKLHGFLLGVDGYTVIDYPDANGTRLWAINARGEISGEFQAAVGGAWQAFTLRHGTFTAIDVPGANMSAGYGIDNQGDVVGHFTKPGSSKMIGYRLASGTFSTFAHPLSGDMMSCAQGIGVHGEVVGHYLDPEADQVFGWVWVDGEFVATLQVPAAIDTYATSITPAGVIAGYHFDENWVSHGFIATPLNRAGL